MAFNWQTFRTRTLTAIVFAAVMLTGLFWNRWSFFVLFSVIHFGCWWEYLKLNEKIFRTQINSAIKYFLSFSGYILFFIIGFPGEEFDITISFFSVTISLKWLIYIIALSCMIIFLLQNKKIPTGAKWMAIGGFIYISLSLGLMLSFYRITDINIQDTKFVFGGNIIPVLIIASIWINDTMAYIVGSLIGKTPLSKISPKKTWEGTVGGIILAVIALYTWFIVKPQLNLVAIPIAILTLIAAVSGTVGDLFESKLKRMAGVKDSGNIMPGHGGFLDRFDSLLFAIPFVWFYVTLFLH